MKRMLAGGMFFAAMIFYPGFWNGAFGQQFTILNQKTERFVNRDCEKTDSCDLLQFTVVTEDYVVYTGGEPNYGTRMYAEYETDKVGNLSRYAIVQFLRGCKFTSFVDDRGVVEKGVWSVVKSFDEFYQYHFPRFATDSFDKDPVYSSSAGETGRNRIGKYLWSVLPWSWDKNLAEVKRYQYFVPTIPRLFITDRPSPAFKMGAEAENISVRFRTCIYKSKDVPGETTRDNVDFATPISCLPWSSSFIYDFTAGKFDSPTEIDPFCLEPGEIKIFK